MMSKAALPAKGTCHYNWSKSNILRRFRNGEPGDICRTNRIIQHVGYRHYCLWRSQTSKPVAVRKSVMQEMRELARLLIKFRKVAREEYGLECELGMEEMLSRVHHPLLRQASLCLHHFHQSYSTQTIFTSSCSPFSSHCFLWLYPSVT